MSKKVIIENQIDKFWIIAANKTVKFTLLFATLLLTLQFLGCSFFQNNKKTKMVEPPPYYQQQHQQHQNQYQHQHQEQNQNSQRLRSNVNNLITDDSKVFHRSEEEIVNVKVFRDTELEKLQRESIELDKMKKNTESPSPSSTTKTTTKKSWFSSWFGNNKNNENKNKNPENTPYMMSEKAKQINSNLL
ncbi:MAG: hypothetical protein LBB88_11865 [Planctomycetaceae bacterium]|jgi:hypothetical protein|nr:hypothetical protein [Planctomycetaceae bacterium]